MYICTTLPMMPVEMPHSRLEVTTQRSETERLITHHSICSGYIQYTYQSNFMLMVSPEVWKPKCIMISMYSLVLFIIA